jgi:Flp pilus assembly protein TadD
MKMKPMPQQVKKTLVISIYFALLISTLLVFRQVRNFDFVSYDDNDYVTENQHVVSGLTFDNIIWVFTANVSSHWHPLTWISLMLDCQLFGPNPGRIHLINLLLHILNTLLLFAVFKKMTNAIWQSAFVAALFALHPLHVESVAWISERKDVLSTFFWLLTMWAYLRYVKRPGVGRYLLTLLIFVLGLMSKPMVVTLPFVLLLLDYWPLERIAPVAFAPGSDVPNRQRLKNLLIEKIPFFALSVISSVITFLVMRSGGTMSDILSFNQRIANVFLSYVQYISKMLWPSNLAVFYPFNAGSISFGSVAICALLLLGISFFVVRYGRHQRYLLLGWFWFVVTLIPVIGIIQVGLQAYADRYTYIPYIGLFVMIAWGLPQLLSKWAYRKIFLGLSMVIVLTALGICAHRQTSYWKNGVTLFSHALEATQNNCVAYNNLGVAYAGHSRWREAIEAYKQSIRIDPERENVYYNLGTAYGSLGRWDEAIEEYKQAIKIKPDYTEAYNNLGAAYGRLGRWNEAIDVYKQAIKIKPNLAESYTNLGIAYGNLSRYTGAIETFKQVIKIKPDYANAHYNLGITYLEIGDKNSALAEYNILKSLNSEMANKLLNQINK